MHGTDLMGGYAAYTNPRAAVEEMATSDAAVDAESITSGVSIVISLVTITPTILTN
jgi:hypothetical protein